MCFVMNLVHDRFGIWPSGESSLWLLWKLKVANKVRMVVVVSVCQLYLCFSQRACYSLENTQAYVFPDMELPRILLAYCQLLLFYYFERTATVDRVFWVLPTNRGTGFRNACCRWCIKWRKCGLVLSGHRSFQLTCGPVFPLLFHFSLFFALSTRDMEGQWGVLSLFEGRELWNSSPTVFLTIVVLTEMSLTLC